MTPKCTISYNKILLDMMKVAPFYNSFSAKYKLIISNKPLAESSEHELSISVAHKLPQQCRRVLITLKRGLKWGFDTQF